MERRRFPEAHELIAGHFVRHSDAYYRWRIADREKISADERTPADFDDLAVAYEKLGDQEQAIEIIRRKIDRRPNEGRYKSEANLGTFLIHSGRLEEGLEHIQRAIEINPNAHFGREIYQQLLVEYLLERRQDDPRLPLAKNDSEYRGFAWFVIAHPLQDDGGSEENKVEKAIRGVLGMMRFGRHDSPALLEALGDLLTHGGRKDAKLLGARAYLKASYEVDDQQVSAAYRQKAAKSIAGHMFVDLEDVENELISEIEQGDRLFAKIAKDEQIWISEGRNLDDEFAQKYYKAPRMRWRWAPWQGFTPDTLINVVLFLATAVAVVLIALAFVYRRRRRRAGGP